MEIPEFRIGAEFARGYIGRRIIAAIRLDEVRAVPRMLDGEAVEPVPTRAEAEADGWFNGLPRMTDRKESVRQRHF